MSNSQYNAKVVIVDFHLGNLFSVKHACDFIGIDAEISSDPAKINTADALILPGVGAFGDAMKSLHELGLIDPILKSIDSGKPFFGICLGMQLLFDESEEFGNNKGLGVIKGQILKFPSTHLSKQMLIPQIAWNKIAPSETKNTTWEGTPLTTLAKGDYMYFVHSYYAQPDEDDHILCQTSYNEFGYCSGVKKENVFAVQFHPEKSGLKGLEIYRNWANQNLK